MDGSIASPATSTISDDHVLGRYLALFILAVAAAALGTAYVAQFAFGYEPCPLCFYQRIPYWAAAGLAIAALVLGPPLRTGFLMIAGVAFVVGSGLAVYHVGVEQHWWASATCGGQLPGAMTGDQLLAALTQKAAKGCDEVDWAFLGVSMATWNAIASPIIAAILFYGTAKLRKASPT